MKVKELIKVMQDIGHFEDELAVTEMVRDKNSPMGMRYRDVAPVCAVSTGDEGEIFYIVASKMPEMHGETEKPLEPMAEAPAAPEPVNTGFLGLYSGQETEGHPYPVVFAEKRGKPDYDLAKMKGLDGETVIVVFNSKRSNKAIYSGKVRECPNIYQLCEKEYPVLLVT